MHLSSPQKIKALVHGFLFVLWVLMPFVFSDALLERETTLRYLLSGMLLAGAYIGVAVLYMQGSISLPTFSSASSCYRFLGVFVLLSGTSLLKSINPGEAIYEYLKLIMAVSLLLLFLVFYVNDATMLRTVSRYAAIAVASFTLIALSQVGNSLAAHHHFAIDFTLASSLGNKNFYAETMILFLPLCIMGVVLNRGFWRWFAILQVLVLVVTLITLQTLSTWLAAVLSLVIVAVFFLKYFDWKEFSTSLTTGFRRLLLSAAVLLGLFMLLLIFKNISLITLRLHHIIAYVLHPQSYSSSDPTNVNSIAERISLWKNAWRVFKEYPLLGCGAENWKLLAPHYGLPFSQFSTNAEIRYIRPHNDWLLILAEQGIVGFMVYVSIFVSALYYGWRTLQRTEGNTPRLTLMLIGIGVLCYMVVAACSLPSSRFYTVVLLMLFFALLTTAPQAAPQVSSPRRTPLWMLWILIAILNGVATSYISASRYVSEVHLIYALQAQTKSDWHQMAYHAGQAKSYFFPLDFTATPIAWYEGRAYFSSATPSVSKFYFEEALRRNPYHLHAINDLATINDREGNTDKAMKLYNDALAMAPLFTYAYMNKAILLYNAGARDSAYRYMHQYPERKALYRNFMTVILTDKLRRYVSDTATASHIINELGGNILAMDTVAEVQHQTFEEVIRERYLNHSK